MARVDPAVAQLRPVQAEALRAGYGTKTVLRGLSFELRAQGVSVLVGPGGSGKSTLLRVLRGEGRGGAGFWWEGRLFLPGAAPCSLLQHPEAEIRSLEEVLTGSCCDPARCRWGQHCHVRDVGSTEVSGGGVEARVRDIWRSAHAAADLLVERLAVPIGSLPVGLAALARLTGMVAIGSPFLLLDEPDAEMEAQERRWLASLMRDLSGRRTLVLATHNVRLAKAVADLVLLLVEGRIVESAPGREFFDRPRSIRARQFVRMGN